MSPVVAESSCSTAPTEGCLTAACAAAAGWQASGWQLQAAIAAFSSRRLGAHKFMAWLRMGAVKGCSYRSCSQQVVASLLPLFK